MEVNEVNKPITSNECTILLDAIHSNMTSVRAEIKASGDFTNMRINELVKRMDTQNGNVAKLQKLSNDRQAVIDDFHRLEKELKDRQQWFKKNLFYLIVGAVIFTLVVVIVYDVIGLQGVIDLAKGMK
jgi:Flp pilus assembly protein TadB